MGRLSRSARALAWRGLLGLAGSLAFTQPCLANTANTEAGATSGTKNQVEQARRIYDQALKLFDKGRHRAALASFQRAYELAPSYRIFYNIALVHVALDDPAASITAFERYLREGGSKVSRQRSDQVAREVLRLSRRAASLTIHVVRSDAEVWLDGELVGKSPLSGPVWVNPGKHRIRVSYQQGPSETKTVEVSGGDERLLQFESSESDQAVQLSSPRPKVPPPHDNEDGASAHFPWLAWGITGALGTAAGVSSVVALSARANEKDLQATQGVEGHELQAARQKVENWALATDILLGATLVGAGVSLYLTLDGSDNPNGSDSEAHEAALVVGPGSVSARYTF